jgi:hypothetical protein
MDTLQFIKQNVRCCISGKPLVDSKHINMVQLHFKASWKFPVWGNILQKIPAEMAVAYVHDDVLDKDGTFSGPVKHAIEIDGEKITYHPVPTCRVCGCTDDHCPQCIKKTGNPCYWIEPDLCSACKQ